MVAETFGLSLFLLGHKKLCCLSALKVGECGALRRTHRDTKGIRCY
jgi:hypothetical protein